MTAISSSSATPVQAEGAAGQHLQDAFLAEGAGTFGRVALDVGLADSAVTMKCLQLLYWLRSQYPLTRPEMLRAMAQWRGTGRSDAVPFEPASSAPALLDRMVKSELLWEMGAPKRFLVSPNGIALLSRLHPAFEDLDLPTRLARWERDWPAFEGEVGRYVRSCVAKQRGFVSS